MKKGLSVPGRDWLGRGLSRSWVGVRARGLRLPRLLSRRAFGRAPVGPLLWLAAGAALGMAGARLLVVRGLFLQGWLPTAFGVAGAIFLAGLLCFLHFRARAERRTQAEAELRDKALAFAGWFVLLHGGAILCGMAVLGVLWRGFGPGSWMLVAAAGLLAAMFLLLAGVVVLLGWLLRPERLRLLSICWQGGDWEEYGTVSSWCPPPLPGYRLKQAIHADLRGARPVFPALQASLGMVRAGKSAQRIFLPIKPALRREVVWRWRTLLPAALAAALAAAVLTFWVPASPFDPDRIARHWNRPLQPVSSSSVGRQDSSSQPATRLGMAATPAKPAAESAEAASSGSAPAASDGDSLVNPGSVGSGPALPASSALSSGTPRPASAAGYPMDAGPAGAGLASRSGGLGAGGSDPGAAAPMQGGSGQPSSGRSKDGASAGDSTAPATSGQTDSAGSTHSSGSPSDSGPGKPSAPEAAQQSGDGERSGGNAPGQGQPGSAGSGSAGAGSGAQADAAQSTGAAATGQANMAGRDQAGDAQSGPGKPDATTGPGGQGSGRGTAGDEGRGSPGESEQKPPGQYAATPLGKYSGMQPGKSGGSLTRWPARPAGGSLGEVVVVDVPSAVPVAPGMVPGQGEPGRAAPLSHPAMPTIAAAEGTAGPGARATPRQVLPNWMESLKRAAKTE